MKREKQRWKALSKDLAIILSIKFGGYKDFLLFVHVVNISQNDWKPDWLLVYIYFNYLIDKKDI